MGALARIANPANLPAAVLFDSCPMGADRVCLTVQVARMLALADEVIA
jgi:hypothetical protein